MGYSPRHKAAAAQRARSACSRPIGAAKRRATRGAERARPHPWPSRAPPALTTRRTADTGELSRACLLTPEAAAQAPTAYRHREPDQREGDRAEPNVASPAMHSTDILPIGSERRTGAAKRLAAAAIATVAALLGALVRLASHLAGPRAAAG
jgi:hypothetical protein